MKMGVASCGSCVMGTQGFSFLATLYSFCVCESFHRKNLKVNLKNIGGKGTTES